MCLDSGILFFPEFFFMPLFNPDELLTQADQRRIDNILEARAEDRRAHASLIDLLNRENAVSQEADALRKQEAYLEQQERLRLSQENQQNLESEVSNRIQQIVQDKTIYDGNSILNRINQDDLLSQFYSTDASKLKLIRDIQSEKERIINPGTALEGYEIDPDKGNSPLNRFKETLLDTVGQFNYGSRKIKTIAELNALPSKELRAIDQKRDLAEDIENKMYAATNRLQSLSPADRASALKEVEYYQNELKKLQLSPSEQQLWDQYGDEYLRLSGKLDWLEQERREFTGANVLSPEEAEERMRDYARDYAFSINGHDTYLNPDYALATIKDKLSVKTFTDELANVAATAIPFMIGGIPGVIAKGAALGSDALGYFADSLEAYYRKNGEVDFKDTMASVIGAAFSTVMDFYGGSLLVKGLSKSGLIKEQQKAFKESFDSMKGLLKVNPRSAFYAIAVQTQRNLTNSISESTAKSVIDKAEKAVDKAISGKVSTLTQKSISGLKAANQHLHKYYNVGVQDITKAGSLLGFENVAASLGQTIARGEDVDTDSLIESAVSGLVGGGMFHGVSAPGHVAFHHLKDLYDKHKKTYGIDSDKDFNAAINVLADAKDATEAEALTSAYKTQIQETKDKLDNSVTELKDIANSKYEGKGTFAFNEETHKWEFTPTKASTSEKVLAARYTHALNNLQGKIDKWSPVLQSRLDKLNDVQKTKEENAYKDALNPESELDEEQRQSIFASKFKNLLEEKDKEGISTFLQETQKLAKDKADVAADSILNMPERAKLEDVAEESDKDFFKAYGLINKGAMGVDVASLWDIDENSVKKEEEKQIKRDIKSAVAKGDYAAFNKALEADTTLSPERKEYLRSVFTEDRLDDIAEQLDEEERAKSDNVVNVTGGPDKVGTAGKEGERGASYSSFSRTTRRLLEKEIENERLEARKKDAPEGAYAEYLAKKAVLDKLKENPDTSIETLVREGYSRGKEIIKKLQDYEKVVREKPRFFGRTYKTKEEAQKALDTLREKTKKKGGTFAYKIQGIEGYKYYIVNTLKDKDKVFKEFSDIAKDDSKTLGDLLDWWGKNGESLKDVAIGDRTLSEVITSFTDKVKNVSADTEKNKKIKAKLVQAINSVTTYAVLSSASNPDADKATTHRYTSPLSRAQRHILQTKAEESAKADAKAINATTSLVDKKSWEDISADVKQAYMQIINKVFAGVNVDVFNNDNLSSSINTQNNNTPVNTVAKILQNADTGLKFNQWDTLLLEEYRKKISSSTNIDTVVKNQLLEEIRTLQSFIEYVGVVNDGSTRETRVLRPAISYKGVIWNSREEEVEGSSKINGFIRFLRQQEVIPNQDTDFLEGNWSGTKTEVSKRELHKIKAQANQRLAAVLHSDKNLLQIQRIFSNLRDTGVKTKEGDVEETNLLTLIADNLGLKGTDRAKFLSYADADVSGFTDKEKVDFVEDFLRKLCASSLFLAHQGFLRNLNEELNTGLVSASVKPKAITSWEDFAEAPNANTKSIQDQLKFMDGNFGANGAFILHILDSYGSSIDAKTKEAATYYTIADSKITKDNIDIPKGSEYKTVRDIINSATKIINKNGTLTIKDIDDLIKYVSKALNAPATDALAWLEFIVDASQQATQNALIQQRNKDVEDYKRKNIWKNTTVSQSINDIQESAKQAVNDKINERVRNNMHTYEHWEEIVKKDPNIGKNQRQKAIIDKRQAEADALKKQYQTDATIIQSVVNDIAEEQIPPVRASKTIKDSINNATLNDNERLFLNAAAPRLIASALKNAVMSNSIDFSNISTRDKVIKLFKLLDVYSNVNSLEFTEHQYNDPMTTTEENLSNVVEVVAKNGKTFNDVLTWLEEKNSDGRTNRQDLAGLGITTADTQIIKAYTDSKGNFKLNDIKNLIKDNPDIARRLAKTLQAYINNATNANGTKGLFNTVGLSSTKNAKQKLHDTSNTDSIGYSVQRSAYNTDIRFNPKAVSPLGTTNFASTGLALNADYVCASELAAFLKLLETLKENAGYFSESKGNLADEIFGSTLNGAFTYNDEILNIMGGVALFHVATLTGKQSEDYIKNIEATGRFTNTAAKVFVTKKFIDTATLAYDMGTQIAAESGLRKGDRNARAAVFPRLVTALGGRAYGLLEKEGYIEKYYFNVKTGEYKKTITDAELRSNNWQRATMITAKGERLQSTLKNLTKPKMDSNNKRHHLNTDIFNYDRETAYKTSTEYADYQQEKLTSDFGITATDPLPATLSDNIRHTTGKDAKGNDYDLLINDDKETVAVNLQRDPAKTPHWVFLPRSSYIKKDDTKISNNRLIEIAWQWDTEWVLDADRVLSELSFLQGCNTYADLIAKYANDQETLKNIFSFLDFTWDKHRGLYKERDNADNIAKFNQWKDLYDEVSGLTALGSGTQVLTLHFPMTNTINNRVYVQSPKINNREFKPTRNYFRPTGHAGIVIPNINDVPGARSDVQQNILKAITLANFGFDTDKVPLNKMGEVFDALVQIPEFISLINDAPNLSAIEIVARLKDENLTKALAKIEYSSTKKEKAELELETNAEAVLAIKELARDGNLQKILNNEEIKDFKLRIEIDGLTNGTSIHLATSGALGNEDTYTYQMLVGVGIFTKPYNGDETLRDYVSAKMADRERVEDTYEATGTEALHMATDNIIEAVAQGIQNNPSLRDFAAAITYIGTTFYKAKDLTSAIKALFERNILKYVTMPSSYGAGRNALIAYLLDEFSKKISEAVAKNIDTNLPAVIKMYEHLSRINKKPIILRDADNNTISFKTNLDRITLDRFSFVAEDNAEIASMMTEYIFEYAAKATEKRMQLAKNHSMVLMGAVDNVAKFFNLAIAEVLTSDIWKSKSLEDLTNADLESITSQLGLVLNIDADETSLNALRNATISAIELVKLHQKVPSYFNDGTAGLILNAKSTLTKESIATALSPEFNHGRDSGIINRCQSSIRDSLGEFLGIHDAAIVTYAQIQNREANVGTAFQEQFVENTMFTYRPLIQTLKKLQAQLNYMMAHPDFDKKGSAVADIQKSIEDLTVLIQEQIAGKLFRLKEVENGKDLTINQYAMHYQTGITLKADGMYVEGKQISSRGATALLKDINEDMKDVNMVAFKTEEASRFAFFVRQRNKDLYDQIKDVFVSFPETMDEFEYRVTKGALKLNENQIKNLRPLIDQYKEYIKGEYNESFFHDIFNAQNNREHEHATIVSKVNNANAARATVNTPASQLVTLIELMSMVQSIGAFGAEGNNTVFNRMFMQRAIKLSQRMSTEYGAWSLLDNVVAMFSNEDTTSLGILHKMMQEIAYEGENEELHLVDLASLQGANVVEINVGDGVSLESLLQEFNSKSFAVTGLNPLVETPNSKPSAFLEGYIRRYMDRIAASLSRDTDGNIEDVTLTFKMDNALSRILLAAVNNRINNNSRWKKVKIALIPPLTNQANLDVNKNICLTNLVQKRASKFNSLSFVLSNNKKDLEHLNFEFNNQFVPASIRAGVLYETNFNVSRDPTKVSADTAHNLRLKESNESYIFSGNNVGWLSEAQRDIHGNLLSAKDTAITDFHLYTGEQAQDFVDNDLAARNFDSASDTELYNRTNSASIISLVDDTNRILDGKTDDWVSEIEDDTVITVPTLTSGLAINNPAVYGAISSIPAFAQAYEQAKKIHKERLRLYENGVYKNRSSVFAPITVKDVYYKGTRVHLRFQVSADNEVNVAELAPYIILAPNMLKYRKEVFILSPETPTYLKEKFAYSLENLFNASISDRRPDGINKFFRDIKSQSTLPNADRKYIRIPERIFNRNNKKSFYVSEESAAANDLDRISTQNAVTAINTDNKIIYLGEETNPGRFFNTNKQNILVSFTEADNTKDIINGVVDKIKAGFDTKVVKRKEHQIGITHGYGNKPVDQMTREEFALYKDTSCQQLRDIARDLNAIDAANGIDNSLVNETIAAILDANVLVRTYLNEELGRDGTSTLAMLNNTKVGFVQYGVVRDGSGSNTETFGHELGHIPVEFLKLDPTAYKQLVDLYKFVAQHITWDDFTYQDAEDKRIFDYIFNNPNTAEPEAEFLVYAVTNKRFRDALDNVSKHANVAKEFDSRLQGVMNKLLDKLNPYSENRPKNINQICATLFKRGVELTKAYYHEHNTIPKEAYQRETSKLERINQKVVEFTAKLTTAVGTWLASRKGSELTLEDAEGAGNYVRRIWDTTNPYTSLVHTGGLERYVYAQGRMTELMPSLVENIDDIKGIKSDLANELKQSFEGVSANNWEYVKLRMAAKDTVDKAREQGASAVNNVVVELTKDIDTKTANNLTEYVIHTDMQCLLDSSRNIDDVVKLMTSKEARYNEIKRIESRLSKEPYGKYYINASRGLANKLVHGVNTSGIGYNNAYEIANFCGTKYETDNSSLTQEIDQLVTLYAMHEYNKANPRVYMEMRKHPKELEGLLTLHGHLIQNEKAEVYAESNQSNHIPKGELHGGKSNNRYEIIPEEQLKAYQWTGYRKIKNIQLDSFYSDYTNGHKYVAVGAKYMPDIPYTDGIPVLTDIYNGRNKANIYVDNLLVDDMHIDPTLNEHAMYFLDKYMNTQIGKLNSDKFVQNDYKKIDGVFTPTYGLTSGLSGATFAVNEKTKDKYLAKNYKITAVLGDHYGSIIERSKAPEWNTKVAEALDQLYNDRKAKNDFTWLTKDETDPEKQKIYKLIPYEIKSYFNEKYGDKGVPVETRYITGILGYKNPSASSVDSNIKYYEELKHTYMDYVDHVLHSAPAAYTESLMKYLTRIGKENLVIKGIAVSIGNIVSNNVTLGVLGLTPKQVCQYQAEGLKAYNAYRELAQEKSLLDLKYVTNNYTDKDAARYRVIESAMHSNPISYLAENGAIPQVAEDLSQSDRFSKDLIDKYFPKHLQGIGHQIAGDQKSFMYNKLEDLATNGDIVGKYALFKHLTEDNHINKDEALRQAIQTFVDYSNPLPRNIQYLDSIGALPFTKFLFGTQTNIINSLVKNPAGALTWIGANRFMGIGDIYNAVLGFDSLTYRWHMPGFGLWYDSLDQVPSMRVMDALSSL